jgi:hypothetical protein
MAKFVGFAESPKPPEGAQLVVISATVTSEMSQHAIAATIFSKTGASYWLGEFTKYDLSLGGKVLFAETSKPSITFTAVNLPKQVTLISDLLGELEIVITKSKTNAEMQLRFSRWVLPEEREIFEHAADQTTKSLAAALEV